MLTVDVNAKVLTYWPAEKLENSKKLVELAKQLDRTRGKQFAAWSLADAASAEIKWKWYSWFDPDDQ